MGPSCKCRWKNSNSLAFFVCSSNSHYLIAILWNVTARMKNSISWLLGSWRVKVELSLALLPTFLWLCLHAKGSLALRADTSHGLPRRRGGEVHKITPHPAGGKDWEVFPNSTHCYSRLQIPSLSSLAGQSGKPRECLVPRAHEYRNWGSSLLHCCEWLKDRRQREMKVAARSDSISQQSSFQTTLNTCPSCKQLLSWFKTNKKHSPNWLAKIYGG